MNLTHPNDTNIFDRVSFQFQLNKGAIDKEPMPTESPQPLEVIKNQEELQDDSKVPPPAPKKKKRARGRRRKPKARKVESVQQRKKVPQVIPNPPTTTKKQHDAPMKKKDLYFSFTCSMVSIKGGALAVARVSIVNWDLETVLDTFVHVPVPVTDFLESGISPDNIRKSKSNTNATSFSAARQSVEQILRGKILIGHQLSEKLTALGLTHPSTDVRDTAVFFRDINLRNLTKMHLERDLPETCSADFPLKSCAAALDIYKAFRREWEQDLIQKSQQSEQTLQKAPPMYTVYHDVGGRPRFPSYEMRSPPPMAQSQSHFVPPANHHHLAPPRPHFEADPSQATSPSWFVNSAPVLSSQAIEALSSSDYSPYDSYEQGSTTMSYDSTIYASSTGYAESIIDGSSALSESEMAQAASRPSSSSWFRFGSRRSSSSSATSPRSTYPQQQTQQVEHMSALSEVPEDGGQWEYDTPTPYVPPRYFTAKEPPSLMEDPSSRQQRWFGFRRPKSPNSIKREDGLLKLSPSQAIPDLPSSAQGEAPSSPTVTFSLSTATFTANVGVSDKNSHDTSTTESSDLDEKEKSNNESFESDKSSSSWFNFRRGKSPTRSVEVKEQPAADDEDWMREVMDQKPAAKEDSKEVWKQRDLPEEMLTETSGVATSKPSSSRKFRFLRSSRSPKDDDKVGGLEGSTAPASSFGDDTPGWSDQLLLQDKNNIIVGDWTGSEESSQDNANKNNSAIGLFFPPARSRLPTESTIPSVATEDIEDEEEEEFSPDVLQGIEQNLAFLNI